MNPDMIFCEGSEVGQLALDGLSSEDGAILSVFALVGQKHFVSEVVFVQGFQGIELWRAVAGVAGRRTPTQQGAAGVDLAHLKKGKVVNCFFIEFHLEIDNHFEIIPIMLNVEIT